MSQKLSNKSKTEKSEIHHLVHRSGAMARPVKKPRKTKQQPGRRNKWSMLFILPAWVLVSFVGSSLLLSALILLLGAFRFDLTTMMPPAAFDSAFAALTYLLAFTIAFGVPLLFSRGRVTLETLGLTRLVSWMDIGLVPIGFIAYLVGAWAIMAIAIALFPGFAPDQMQNVGFTNITDQTGYLLAFTTLVVIAPIAEELLFRGYLYGKLRGHVPMYAAILMTSVLFALVHMQWNVGLNVFALSIVMCGLREITGSIWAGILLHMAKNAVAFYILFAGSGLLPGVGA